MRLALVFDFLKVEAQSPDDFSPIPVVELLPKFIESKVDYVVMMDLSGATLLLSSSQILCSRSISFAVRRGAWGPR